jgi:hypothetical protein
MGRKHAKIISRDAFMQSFVEAEVLMRKNLGARIEVLIEKETNADIITGLKQAQELVAGKVEINETNG